MASRYSPVLKCSDVSMRMVGALAGSDEATSVQTIIPRPDISVAPTTVKPYAQSMGARGHVRELRQSRRVRRRRITRR